MVTVRASHGVFGHHFWCLPREVAAAAAIRDHLGVDDAAPLGPMADVAAALGLHVSVINAPIDGASLSPRVGLGVSVLGDAHPSARRRFTCAHKIGHHLTGDEHTPAGTVGDSRAEREQRINAFAAALLLPPDVRTATTREEMIRLSGTYRVSWSLAVAACGQPEVGQTPVRAEFLAAGIELTDDLEPGHRSMQWRQAVLRARNSADLTDDAALRLLGKPPLTLDDLPAGEEALW